MKRIDLETLPRNTRLRMNTPPAIHVCAESWNWSPRPLVDFDLWCVLKGEGELTLNGSAHRLRVGTCFVLPPGSRVKARQQLNNRLSVFYLHFDLCGNRGASLSPERLPLPSNPIQTTEWMALQFLAQQLIGLYYSKSRWAVQRCEFLFWQIIFLLADARVGKTRVSPDDRIQRVLQSIQESLGAEWSIERMAAEAGVSRTQLNRLFIQSTGVSPQKYLSRARLDQARYLLEESDQTIAEIADTLGYCDVYFFGRMFKRYFGASPGAIRKAKRV